MIMISLDSWFDSLLCFEKAKYSLLGYYFID